MIFFFPVMADLSLHVVFFFFFGFLDNQFCNEKFHKKEFLISQKGKLLLREKLWKKKKGIFTQ